jgi:hypothetical protein
VQKHREFKANVLPEITRRFSGQSGFGSDRAAAESNASGALARELARAYESYQGTRMQAALGLAGMDTSNIQDILGVQQGSAAARLQDQLPLNAQYSEFQRQQQARQMSIENLLKALGVQGVENIATVTPGTAGGIQSFLGGFGSGLGQYLSDARLKTNITRIGTHIRGFSIYLFQYIWSDKWFVGAMAQELQVSHPETVITHPSGILSVDYKKLCM